METRPPPWAGSRQSGARQGWIFEDDRHVAVIRAWCSLFSFTRLSRYLQERNGAEEAQGCFLDDVPIQ